MQVRGRSPDCCSCGQDPKCCQNIPSVRVENRATSLRYVGAVAYELNVTLDCGMA